MTTAAETLLAQIDAPTMPTDEIVLAYVEHAIGVYGTISETARRLGMHRRTVQRIIQRAKGGAAIGGEVEA